jgi:hypothetical protein
MTALAKKRSGRRRKWYMSGSVLNALWGNIMPRLAASVWRGSLKWPPDTGAEPLKNGLEAHPLDDNALAMFARQLIEVGFGTEDNYLKAAKGRNRLTKAQLSTLVAVEYFHPGVAEKYLSNRPDAKHRVTLRVIEAEAYDFILSDMGFDVFVPPTPGFDAPGPVPPDRADAARQEVLQFYKFRETSKPPIGLPGPPSSPLPEDPDSFITIPQLTAPTGSHQVPEAWVRALAEHVDWWLSGSLYRGLMSAYPRIIASMWYEEVAWGAVAQKYTPEERAQTYRARLERGDGLGKGDDDLKEMLEERVETVLPERLGIFVPEIKKRPEWLEENAPGWNENDIMLASDGIYFPDPGPAPSWNRLLDAIEKGVAGNPVFTDSGPCAGPCA